MFSGNEGRGCSGLMPTDWADLESVPRCEPLPTGPLTNDVSTVPPKLQPVGLQLV